ncbi:MAG: hypothetical protein ACKVHP_04365 [Verrucomicrobiales bacterium]
MENNLQCPACRKKHLLPLDEAVCTRCGLDFSSLLEVREAASRLRQQAVKQLSAGAYEEALVNSPDSWNLKKPPASARLAYVLCLAQGDFDTAEEWRSTVFGSSLRELAD